MTGVRAGRVLVVAGSPNPSSPELVARLAEGAETVIAVDRGVDWCEGARVPVTLIVGDEDTVTEAGLDWAVSQGALELTFDPEKDDTDLSLAFRAIRERGLARPGETVVTCASGGRPDHALGVFGVLADQADLAPRLVEDGYECRILSPAGEAVWEFGGSAVGQTFSAVGIGEGTSITERGMHWVVDHLAIRPLQDRAVSNVIEGGGAWVRCESGVVAAFLFDRD